MKKERRYRYLGINGILDSAICLEDVSCITYVRLMADKDHILTNGSESKTVVNIYDGDDISEWKEIPVGQE